MICYATLQLASVNHTLPPTKHDLSLCCAIGAGRFPDHRPGPLPLISDGEFNPAEDEGEIGVSLFRQQLIQVHGILMLIAWPLLAFTAIFFAAWMKPALPNGEWFQVRYMQELSCPAP